MAQSYESDILVIGSGISGLLFAYNIAKKSDYTINLITKRDLTESNTRYAQGGVAAVLSDQDSYANHVRDTLEAGAGLCRKNVVEEIVKTGPAIIEQLKQIGVEFDTDDTAHIDLGKEGGHSERRVAHVADATGLAIQSALVRTIRSVDQVGIFEYHTAIDLVTINNRIAGAYVINNKSEEVISFSAKITVLATGGAGKVFLYTSNPDIASGDGHAMAYRAGATMANMEFIQFHPTLYYNPSYRNFLISEALRGEGAILRSTRGRFMENVHEMKELAPRDIVARAIDLEMKKTGEDFVLLDISHKDPEFIKSRFPTIYSTLLEQGLDITKDPIPVVPAAHYTVGGVRAKLNGQTDLDGLLAIGEVAYTGLHGANRLASNSLLEGAVMSTEAVRYTLDQLNDNAIEHYSFPDWETGDAVEPDEAVIVSHNWEEVRRTMWSFVGIVRTTKRLLRAWKRLEVLREEVIDYYWDFHVTPDIIELRNLIHISEMVVQSALFRKESRGTHYTQDYPHTLTDARDTLIQKNLGIFLSEIVK